MEKHAKSEGQLSAETTRNKPGSSTAEDMIKVVDRKGNVKVIPRSQYEQKRRHRKRHEPKRAFPLKDVLSVVFIVVAIIVAAYLALKIVQ